MHKNKNIQYFGVIETHCRSPSLTHGQICTRSPKETRRTLAGAEWTVSLFLMLVVVMPLAETWQSEARKVRCKVCASLATF